MAHAHEENTLDPKFVKELIYQPLELITEYEIKTINNVVYNKLHSVNGMKPYPPDTTIKESCLLDMLKLSGQIEFLMVVTMYNEDRNNFTDTFYGIMENLKHFEEDGMDPKLIGVICIVDGIRPFSQTYFKPDQNPFFANFYDNKMINERFNVKEPITDIVLGENQEISHCFSMNTNFGLEGYPELQMVFCVKQKNKRKLNTHLWFFGGFCKMIKPKYVMLIDVGTKPFGKSLCALYDTMKQNEMIAGVCGEIAPMDPQYANIVVSGQTVEYTFSHIFDKALESCFGYIGVLPGAFSAYKWEALEGGPLEDDYYTTMTKPEIMNAYYSNIFLAEDRVLSLAIVSKPGTTYLLKFVHLAYAETDVPDKIFVLLSQRRRWINGSWFALIETWINFDRIKNSYHSKWRKTWFAIELVYFSATIFISWVMVGSFYLFTELIFGGLVKAYKLNFFKYFSTTEIIMNFYLGLILLMFMMSLGVKTGKVETTYKIIMFFFAVYMLLGFTLLNFFTFAGAKDLNAFSIFLLCATMGSYAIGTVMTSNGKKVFFRTLQFLIITPVYVNMFGIYSICNVHDCSWGNRPEVMTEEELMKVSDFQYYRTKWVAVYIVSNVLYYQALNTSMEIDADQNVLKGLFTFAVILILMRFFGCLWHYITWWIDHRGGSSKRYIALSSAAAIENQNKRILTEINEKLTKTMGMGGTKAMRETILELMEGKGKDKLGSKFHQSLAGMLDKSRIIDSDESDDAISQIIELKKKHKKRKLNQSAVITKKKKEKKHRKEKKKKTVRNGRTIVLKESVLKEEEDVNYGKTKDFLNDVDMSAIKGHDSGVFEFDVDDQRDLAYNGVIDLNGSEHKEFFWDDDSDVKYVVEELDNKPRPSVPLKDSPKRNKPRSAKARKPEVNNRPDQDIESSYSVHTDNTEEAEKYLDMLDSIIQNVSLNGSEV